MLCWGSVRGLYRTEVKLVKKKLNWTEVVFRRFINLSLVLVHTGFFCCFVLGLVFGFFFWWEDGNFDVILDEFALELPQKPGEV